jgi:hypothetical protein
LTYSIEVNKNLCKHIFQKGLYEVMSSKHFGLGLNFTQKKRRGFAARKWVEVSPSF